MFTCCSTGVFCVKSYHQCGQREIFEAHKSKDVNRFIKLNNNIIYRQENCDLLGYNAATSVNSLQKYRDVKTLSSSRVFLTLSGSS